MEKKTRIIIFALLALTLLLNIALFALLKMRGDITGFSTKGSEEAPLLEDDIIELNKADLSKCCTFTNLIGEEDSCYALKGHDCSYCAPYCG
jgi:hypothetical protein